ncbi:ATP-binding protein [Ketogulonicigenium vulgare]|uniref:histidine kinase n=3 Tax=Ketogulonicigenium vulgare TaxID=92945 RepID=F9Y522_KETVW|nr:ATP-binding protein [Ketogulonicigenium vulgare]AEM40654.1 Sensor protein [Ketogulonicigenium vulgare WSH-001]ALJ80827.1 hypothetical protein KVH_06335 [Ketogulonicigenium vulgare]ANW33606.1 hypothetical protein KvSKV_06305 [Ketogulonicigenium vulgare]
MISLRLRLSLVLIGSILAVVFLATVAVLHVIEPRYVDAAVVPIVNQLEGLARLAEADPDMARLAGVEIATAPFRLHEDAEAIKFLRPVAEQILPLREIVISRGSDAAYLIASMSLSDGHWMIAQVPDFSAPEDRFVLLGMWIGLITLGTAGMALYVASGISRPLAVVERAMQRIGPDGVIPHVPESGPPEIRHMARTLNQLSQRLRKSMESRMRLVAAAGHDLRTPLTRMRLRAEFIADPEEQAKWLSDLEEMDVIADSAIRLVREEVGPHARETIDLRGPLGDVMAELEEGAVLTAIPSRPVIVQAELIGLKRALRNLISNAVLHGGGASVYLQIDCQSARIVIRDNGPGIPDELLERVFEPFFRVDMARRKSVPGAGLGLAIAKEIIERFDGTISIRNLKPAGLEQTIILPRTAGRLRKAARR